ncbi:MAG: hypothetical protein ACM3N0_04760 [Chloroflexota bacterium]
MVSSELVIADLTGRNPNVFYELAVRHVTRKPLVQIIRAEEDIPFDVQGMRTVKFELSDPDVLERAREALEKQVVAVLEEGEMETPISQAIGQQLAIESGDPQQVELAELFRAMQALTAEVRTRSGQQLAWWSYRPEEVDVTPYVTLHGELAEGWPMKVLRARTPEDSEANPSDKGESKASDTAKKSRGKD